MKGMVDESGYRKLNLAAEPRLANMIDGKLIACEGRVRPFSKPE